MGIFKALPIGAQIAILLVALAGAGGAYWAWRSDIFNKGVAHERAEQKERDDEAVGQAADGRGRVGRCYDAGGVWDQSRGVCHRR